MESKILNFPDAMRLAEFLERHKLSWMFFDASLTIEDILTLLHSSLSEESYTWLMWIVVGDVDVSSPKNMLISFIQVLTQNGLPELLTFYRKQIGSR